MAAKQSREPGRWKIGASLVIQVVGAEPVPKGSMKAFMPKGARYPVISDTKATELKVFERDVRRLANHEMNALGLPCATKQPFELCGVFYLPRAGKDFGPAGLRPDAPCTPWNKPDWDKLSRAACDAFTGIVWDDDCRIVRGVVEKRFATQQRDVGLWIRVTCLPGTMRELAEQKQLAL